jgi:inward rectifier potassium channel
MLQHPTNHSKEAPATAGDSTGRTANRASMHGPKGRRKIHWNLRSFHGMKEGGDRHPIQELQDVSEGHTQCAYDILLGSDSSIDTSDPSDSVRTGTVPPSIPIRTGTVDGREITFELRNNITQKPIIDKATRLRRSLVNTNVERSHWEFRLRFWMMRFSVLAVSITYLAIFVALNVVFAGLFYANAGQCCDDPSLTFRQVFDFSVQTSTTIGYGGYLPSGIYANFLVFALSFLSILFNTIFAGLLFAKFVMPTAKVEFSEIMTMCNINGLPCLSLRVGNCDGNSNVLTDVNVYLTYTFFIPFQDENGEQRQFSQTEELKLLSNRRHRLTEVWTLVHPIDENSPLFGLNFQEHPGNAIVFLRLTVDAVQDITKSSINIQAEYSPEDILIGHVFQDQISMDMDTRVVTCDYAKMNETKHHPVWYPATSGIYNKK